MHLPRSKQLRALMVMAGVALGLVAVGCYVGPVGAGLELEVDVPPPPPQEEVVITQPGPDHVWIAGYWDWDLGVRHYVWKAGRWERPPHHNARWEPPRFEERKGRRYYHRGHWRD